MKGKAKSAILLLLAFITATQFTLSMNCNAATVQVSLGQLTTVNIGSVDSSSNISYLPGSSEYELNALGGNVSSLEDNFKFNYMAWSGNGEVIARIGSITGDSDAKTGIMIRSGFSQNSSYAYLYMYGNGSIGFSRRWSTGQGCRHFYGNYTGTSVWLKLARNGSNVRGYYSSDGYTWTFIADVPFGDLADTAYVGLAAVSDSALTTSRIDSLTASTLPVPYDSANIGNSPPAGVSTYDNDTKTFTIQSAGGGISGSSDSGLHFVYRELYGNGSVIARVPRIDNVSGAAAGVMLRSNLSSNSSQVFLNMDGSGNVNFVRRAGIGSGCYFSQFGSMGIPGWLKLERVNSSVNAYTSTDGVNWTLRLNTPTVSMQQKIYVGVAVHSGGTNNTVSADFDNAKVIAENPKPALDNYLDTHVTAPSPLGLITTLMDSGISIDSLKDNLLSGRQDYPNPPQTPGILTSQVPLNCDHVNYSTEYFIYVPSNYSNTNKTPLVIQGHGGNSAMSLDYARSTAESYINYLISGAEANGYIVVAPVTTCGWGAIGNSIIVSLISKLQREYNIDPDKIYITGHSMGGHLSYRSGINLGDRWGAIGPMSGGYDYVADGQVKNLFNVPGFATWGETEPYNINTYNRSIMNWMQPKGYPWEFREKAGGGHDIFPEYIPEMYSFFNGHSRNLYRNNVYFRGSGSLRFDTADANPQWSTTYSWNQQRPIEASTAHWLKVRPLTNASTVQDVSATYNGRNTFNITSNNAQDIRLYLHSQMINFADPVVVYVNGQKVFEKTVIRDMAAILNLVGEYDDRGRLFDSYIDIKIDSNQMPSDPSFN